MAQFLPETALETIVTIAASNPLTGLNRRPARHSPLIRRIALAALLVSLVGVLATFRKADAADGPTDEAEFVTRINALRAERGIAPLRDDPELVRGARSWARQMSAAGGISHMPEASLRADIKESWCKVGENVGEGPDVGLLHDAFTKSPLHLKNLVDPDFDAVGIGIVYAPDETGEQVIYVTQRFLDSDNVCQRQDAAAAATRVAGTSTSKIPTELALKGKTPVTKKTVKKAPAKPAAKAS